MTENLCPLNLKPITALNHLSRELSVQSQTEIPQSECNRLVADQAKAAAAHLLFDLESGDKNAAIAEILKPQEIYDRVFESNSLSIAVDGIDYDLVSYWPIYDEELVIEVMTDIKNRLEHELLLAANLGCVSG